MTPKTNAGCPKDDDGFRSHREIANILGIGRARVLHQEHEALRKLRATLLREEFASVRSSGQKEKSTSDDHRDRAKGLYSVTNGWLQVSQIVSLNNGSTDREDVVRAYRFLKESHELIVKPPAIISTAHGTVVPYTVEAVAEHQSMLHVRCWPKKSASRSVKPLSAYPCTAIVESEFDRDERGSFDIPVLLCIIVSARNISKLEL